MTKGLVSLSGRAILMVISLAVGSTSCGEPEEHRDPQLDGVNPLLSGDSFVPIPRKLNESQLKERSAKFSELYPGVPWNPGEDFYLAIHKRELGEKFFMSGYVRDFFPGAVQSLAASSAGTRVVSFELQNQKLFVFDVDKRKQSSEIFDPDVIVDAFPVINGFGPFDALVGFKDYILIDPSAGSTQFSFISDYLSNRTSPAVPVQVELSYLQNFRAIEDGITYERLISAAADAPLFDDPVNNNSFRAAASMGVAIRRYKEGPNYHPVEMPEQPHYFTSDPFLVPNTGDVKQVAARWDIYPGMEPIVWEISPGLVEIDADPRYADYDIYDAVVRGITGWNEAFGFEVFRAEVAESDASFAHDDRNYLIWDSDPSVGFAFADWRNNPNTGEIRGASVYFGAGWLQLVDIIESLDEGATNSQSVRIPALNTPKVSKIVWNGSVSRPLCVQHVSDVLRNLEQTPTYANEIMDILERNSNSLRGGQEFSTKEKIERYFTSIIGHEVGHTLSLRHNFKGSLVPPSTTTMDYLRLDDRVSSTFPGSYDIAAVRYLYGLSPNLPLDPFCTDHQTRTDPNCVRFDMGENPMEDGFDLYVDGLSHVLNNGMEAENDRNYFERRSAQLLGFVRAGDDDEATLAWQHTSSLLAPPMHPFLANNPVFAPRAAAAFSFVLDRLYLSNEDSTATISTRPGSTAVDRKISKNVGDILMNSDDLRSWESRRLAVDILKVQQTLDAYQQLRDARDTFEQDLTSGLLDIEAEALTEDLYARVVRAISPYFEE